MAASSNRSQPRGWDRLRHLLAVEQLLGPTTRAILLNAQATLFGVYGPAGVILHPLALEEWVPSGQSRLAMLPMLLAHDAGRQVGVWGGFRRTRNSLIGFGVIPFQPQHPQIGQALALLASGLPVGVSLSGPAHIVDSPTAALPWRQMVTQISPAEASLCAYGRMYPDFQLAPAHIPGARVLGLVPLDAKALRHFLARTRLPASALLL